jgi:Tfp pilus assembly protein FimV
MFGYQAGVANLNSQIALQNRDYALSTGETEAKRYGMQAAQRMGAIRAGIGASGIDIGSGSKADVQTSQQAVSRIDLDQIRNNAARKAYGFEVEATQDTAQANLYTKAASDAKSAGEIKALGSLISGAASVADKWYQGSSVFGQASQPKSSNAVTAQGYDASWYS